MLHLRSLLLQGQAQGQEQEEEVQVLVAAVPW